MKSICTISVALLLAASLLTTEAQARGGHSGGGSHGGPSGGSHGMHVNHSRSAGPSHSNHFSSVHQSNFHGSNQLVQSNKLNTLNAKTFTGKPNLAKGLGKGLNKNLAKFDFGKGLNKNLYKKWFPGKSWWGFGFGWGGYGYDGYCGDYWPGCYSPYDNVCAEYYVPGEISCDSELATPDTGSLQTPAAGIVRIVNPAATQTTLGFAINGQPYSLEAGQTQDVTLPENPVIEFDRGSGNDTGRYSLSEGEYRFASTPQGWELYRSNDASLAGAVASN